MLSKLWNAYPSELVPTGTELGFREDSFYKMLKGGPLFQHPSRDKENTNCQWELHKNGYFHFMNL